MIIETLLYATIIFKTFELQMHMSEDIIRYNLINPKNILKRFTNNYMDVILLKELL